MLLAIHWRWELHVPLDRIPGRDDLVRPLGHRARAFTRCRRRRDRMVIDLVSRNFHCVRPGTRPGQNDYRPQVIPPAGWRMAFASDVLKLLRLDASGGKQQRSRSCCRESSTILLTTPQRWNAVPKSSPAAPSWRAEARPNSSCAPIARAETISAHRDGSRHRRYQRRAPTPDSALRRHHSARASFANENVSSNLLRGRGINHRHHLVRRLRPQHDPDPVQEGSDNAELLLVRGRRRADHGDGEMGGQSGGKAGSGRASFF